MSVPESDRRRYRRFDVIYCGKVVLVRKTDGRREFEECSFLDLSYGGMGLRTQHCLPQGEEYQFLIDLEKPLRLSAVVRARIRWTQPESSDCWRLGVEFLESSTGWLGPENGIAG